MRKILPVIMTALVALPLAAQLKLPRASQHAVVTQTIGLTDVTVTYSRPGVKGREIYGALVPYDKVWRSGANEATTISFSDDVTIDGHALPKGTYSLHTIPGRAEWTVIFNSVANQWGSFNYDQAKDTLRVRVKPEKSPFTEWLTYDFPVVSTDSATMVLRWGDVAIPVVINTGTTAKTVAAARAAIAAAKADDWKTANNAAGFALDNGMLAEATEWNEASLKVGQNATNLYVKARIEAKKGHKAEAIKTAEEAIAHKTDRDSAAFIEEIQSDIATWKK